MEGVRLEKLVGKQISREGDWEEKTAGRQGTKKQQGGGGVLPDSEHLSSQKPLWHSEVPNLPCATVTAACVSLQPGSFCQLFNKTKQMVLTSESTVHSVYRRVHSFLLLNCDNLWQEIYTPLLCLFWEEIFFLFSRDPWRNKDYHI